MEAVIIFHQMMCRIWGAGGADGQTNGGGGYDWAIQSVFGRLTYNYNQRYLFETTMRYDGSSKFPQIRNLVSFLL